MSTLTLKVPAKLGAEIDALARKQGVSKSQLIRDILETAVARKRKKPTLSAYDLAKKFCGIVKGAPRDLATNPKYMEGFGE